MREPFAVRPIQRRARLLRAIPALLAAALACGSGGGRAQADETYLDDFNGNTGGWDLSDVGTIEKGALLVHGVDQVHIVQRYASFGPLSDIIVSVQYQGGGKDPRQFPDLAIIAFDVTDNQNYYFVGLNREGAYTVIAVEKGKPRKLVDWTRTKALEKDTNPNLVRIDIEPTLGARELIVSFNGEDMPLVRDPQPLLPDGGDVALGAQNGTFAFSHLQIDAAPNGASTFTDDFQYSGGGWSQPGGLPDQPDHGALTLDGTKRPGYLVVHRSSGFDTQPGWLETKVSWTSGDAKSGGVGLAFAVTNSDTYYAYLVNPARGALSVQAYIAGVAHPVLDWTASRLVHEGDLDLGVVPVSSDEGFSITLFLNGVKVGTVLDESSRPLVTDYGMVAINAVGAFARFTAFGPSAPAPLLPLSNRDAVDTFRDNAMAWALDGTAVQIRDHHLWIDATASDRLTRPNVPLPAAPTAIDLDAAWTGGSPLGAVGLVFDIVDDNDFYAFMVAARGAWQLIAVENGAPRVVHKWDFSPVIVRRGRNVLGVRIEPGTGENATLDLSINGKTVGSASETSARFFCGAVGLCSSVAGVFAQRSIASVAAIRFQGSGIPAALLPVPPVATNDAGKGSSAATAATAATAAKPVRAAKVSTHRPKRKR